MGLVSFFHGVGAGTDALSAELSEIPSPVHLANGFFDLPHQEAVLSGAAVPGVPGR
jgi:hypothetical protein